MSSWIRACDLDDIEQEGVRRFDHEGRTYAVFRSPDDEVFCTDGLCTHEAVHLADGLVMDYEIECPSTPAPSTIVPARRKDCRLASISGPIRRRSNPAPCWLPSANSKATTARAAVDKVRRVHRENDIALIS